MKQDSKTVKTTETTETFTDRIKRLKQEEYIKGIADAKARQDAEDATQTVGYRTSFFSDKTRPFGKIIKVEDGKATVQFEESTIAKYPQRMTEDGTITVTRACALCVIAGKKERITIVPEVGQRGTVETITFDRTPDAVFILDNRQAAA